jgi:cytochrome c553
MRPRTVLAVAFLASAIVVPRCAARRTVNAASGISPPPPVEREQVSDPFQTTIRPILSERCGACHDPGGKMYARLPFDDPHVVASNQEKVLRRLKGADREALQRWIAGLAPAATQR